jgi:NADH-quinone oxidoreductase subunit L
MFPAIDVKLLLVLIPALPLAAAAITAALGRRVLGRGAHLPVVAAIVTSFALSILLVFEVQQHVERMSPCGVGVAGETVPLWSWSHIAQAMPRPTDGFVAHGFVGPGWGDFRIDVALQADPLTAAMLAIVTCVSSLVAIYSIGYLHGDPGYARFFAYVGLFVFSMTMLVSAANFLVLYVFWEAVGLCSYLLIGFWYEKPAAAAAGKKAFLVNRIGDVGFALGIFLIWTTYGTLNFNDTGGADPQLFPVMGVFGQGRLNLPDLFVTDWRATAICLLLLCGACGKSAQFPLHVWLPDAMEGPTPVSALIHAATMVTAGVYMIARCAPLFHASVTAQCAVAVVGGITALLGGIIAVTQTDLKRILAYSTISHLGYMFVALGTGTLVGVTAGMFHLLTHAFFKALLFLGAGSVMHAMGGVIDIRRIGGLRHRMPVTHWTFLVGCLSIAGVIPLAGFWSKDAILAALGERAGSGGLGGLYQVLLASTMFGVLLIDFYMFRPYFLVFYGPERIPAEAGHHAHESPASMTFPLIILAIGAALVGLYFECTHGFARFLAATPSLAYLARPAAGHVPMTEAPFDWGIAAVSTAITLFGIAAAAVIYLGPARLAQRLARAMNLFGLYSLSAGKFFFDPIYDALVVGPMLAVARLAAWFDWHVIDRLVDLCGRLVLALGAAFRPLQNGLIPFYALAMALGLLALLGAMLR